MKKGEVYYANFGNNTTGSEQNGDRLVCVVQNNKGNKYSPTILVCPLTSKNKKYLPTHIEVKGTPKKSIILCEQITTLDKTRIIGDVVYKLNGHELYLLNNALKISLDIF